ncbi:probable GTP-binding protein OBGC2 isoform X2 [Tripterygium wilfordii]|uniref:probable GTP-binding protein OBGC2 isoform X2 n=1 Tax=Tripterygium wilfordii TaxID=458696 RepID=UPI0018F83B3B|nr:probable GTP-binding protein OBGC2 isoform X2 [Tripterygium wilfordii]
MASLATLPSSSSLQSLHFCNDKLFLRHFLPPKRYHTSVTSVNLRYYTITCRLARAKETTSASNDSLIKEPHKYFDHVIITVRSGDGGHGAILSMSNKGAEKSQGKHEKKKTRKEGSYKRDFDGSIILPVGGHGADIVIYADEEKDSLLEFHKKSRYNAKRGGNVSAMGILTSRLHNGLAAPTLRIPVPVGTVVKPKRGKILADLALPGQEVLVSRGGQGGISLLDVPEHRRKMLMASTPNVLRDDNDKVLVRGQPGEEGLPNAGKSTLLAAITLAKPDIADYPFTTLMPNLGRLGGDPALGAGMYSSEATLADLPGLIEGAHLGKGLGRNFLRHLRRTRMLVHVVDAATENPVDDYRTVKEELRMYNPEYLERPYIVVLNKIDLPEAKDRLPYLTEEILRIGSDEVITETKIGSKQSSSSEHDDPHVMSSNGEKLEIEDYPRPLTVVGVSVLKGIKVNEMLSEIRLALRKCRSSSEPLELSGRP